MFHFLGLKLSMALAFIVIKLLHAASQTTYDVELLPMSNADSSKPKEFFSLDMSYQPDASEAICLSAKTRSLTLVFTMIFLAIIIPFVIIFLIFYGVSYFWALLAL